MGEIETGLKIAQKRGWTRIIDIAFATHLQSIKMLFRRAKPPIAVEFKSVESILEERGIHKFSRDYIKRTINEDGTITEEPVHIEHEHNHTTHLLKKLKKSRYDWVFRNFYERVIKRPALKLGVSPERMERIQREKRRKNFPKKEFIAPIDVYPVNGKRAEAPLIPTLLKINSVFRHIKAKINPETKKSIKTDMRQVEIFPAGPVKRTS